MLLFFLFVFDVSFASGVSFSLIYAMASGDWVLLLEWVFLAVLFTHSFWGYLLFFLMGYLIFSRINQPVLRFSLISILLFCFSRLSMLPSGLGLFIAIVFIGLMIRYGKGIKD